MNPIRDLNLDFLIQKRLQQVCIGVNELIFHLYPNTTITIYNSAEIYKDGNSYKWSNNNKFSNCFPVHFLLEKDIIDVKKIKNNNILLSFQGNDQLILIDDFSSFESVTINYNKDIYII